MNKNIKLILCLMLLAIVSNVSAIPVSIEPLDDSQSVAINSRVYALVSSNDIIIASVGGTINAERSTLNWGNFSIGENETINFSQISNGSVTLNRINDSSKSIFGGINNADNIMLMNPIGIVFTEPVN